MRVAALSAFLLLAGTARAAAHDGPRSADHASAWDAAALCLLVAAATLHAIGARRLAARGARLRRVEQVSFWAGWSALAAALAPPLDRAAQVSFSAHMAQHELLMLVGAPLLIVGRPVVPWLWALPGRLRLMAGTAIQPGAGGRLWRLFTAPLTAWALHGIAIWAWHLPALYEAAVRDEAVHALQHGTFIGTAALFWWGLVYGRYGRAAYGASALYVFVTSVHTGILGALFTLSDSAYYPVYAARAREAGLDAVADQQLAGLYMWVPAGIVLSLFGLGLVVAWLSEAERRSIARRTSVVVVLALLTGACSAIPRAEEARTLTGGDPYRGRDRIRHYGCDSCHEIPGVATADASVGPPLAGIASRRYLAGHLENTPLNMMRWIEKPHAFNPSSAMPDMDVTERDSRDITAYLYTLR